MVESNKAFIQHGRETATTTYQTLLQIESDPNKEIYIDNITIEFSSVAGAPYIKVTINGEAKLRDFRPVVAQTKLSFGRDLVFKGKTQKPPILVEIKDTAATPNVTCIVTGVQLPYRRPVSGEKAEI